MKRIMRSLWRWWNEGQILQAIAWELYDALAHKGAPPPPFERVSRPKMPRWMEES